MAFIESKRKKQENILKQYLDVIIVDVLSHTTDDLIKLSTFCPYGDIPVPFSDGAMATWQGSYRYGRLYYSQLKLGIRLLGVY